MNDPDKELEFAEVVGSAKLRNELNSVITFFMSGHSWRTVGGLAILFLVGGFQALHGNTSFGTLADVVVSVLLVIEHGLFGNAGLN